MKISLSLKTLLLGLFFSLLAGCQSAPKGLTPEQLAVLKEQGFYLTDEGWTLDLANRVLFANNVGELNPQTRQTVEKLGKVLLGVGLDKARVDGHTDNTGESSYNQQLSLKRAQSVADVLVSVGMKSANLEVRGRGETAPVADNKSAAGRAENRRVAIVIANQ
ncbi:OmpA family protein [Aeromonas sp. SG16]|uniref:OmpA family protein n=1 Tax=Aeromonas sp. SG16 TaxID=2950548 RepID=UPI00210CD3A2|nr:OmpA family protein [Aeromonas sp. SG16]MCQ4052556.1 OmpA family protein [Aeromonas sp. SG16]